MLDREAAESLGSNRASTTGLDILLRKLLSSLTAVLFNVSIFFGMVTCMAWNPRTSLMVSSSYQNNHGLAMIHVSYFKMSMFCLQFLLYNISVNI
jgi:hypothetical protein